jgi:hypothetical protein
MPPLRPMSFTFYFLYGRISCSNLGLSETRVLQKPLHEMSLSTVTVLVVSTRKLFLSSVHRAFVMENTLSVAAFVPGMA